MKNAKCKMKNGFGAVCFASLLACCQSLGAFDVVALVDSLDFAKTYDVETATGTVQVLEHVLLTHANDIWWRDKGGGKMRYPSKCEAWPISEAPFDKRRLPSEDIYGHLRLDAPWAHVYPLVRDECEKRKVGFGIHTTLEENHGISSLTSNWTLDHPQFWGCSKDGEPWMGCCSIAYPEVIDHKMEMLEERLALKPKRILLDLGRNGSWSYDREYSVRMIDEWKRLHGDEPLPNATDPRWIKHVDRHFCGYLRKFSARCHAAGVEFILGMPGIDGRNDERFKAMLGGFDWKPLAAEGVFDAIWLMRTPIDAKRPFESTERIYRDVMAARGKARVYFPLPAYDFSKTSVYTYAKLAKMSAGEATKRLLRLAACVGGCGVVLECVDYRNYTPEVCAAIGEFLKEGADSFELARSSAIARDRPVVYNTDGCDMLYYPTNLPVSAAGFRSLRLDFVKGTTVGTVSYCPVSSGFAHLTTLKAGDLLSGSILSQPPTARNATLEFRDKLGTDSLQMAIDFCREQGKEVFVGLRVNDTHDANTVYGKYFFSPFKKAHPECLMGSESNKPPFCSWTAVDFAQPAVREHMKRFVKDLVENYDVDGIEYDFMRHSQLFKSVAWGGTASADECALMSGLMRELRAITEAAGRKRGRPIVVVVRTPDSVPYAKAIGMDLEAWLSAKTADIWVGGGYFQFEPWEKAVAFAKRHGVKFYASIDESRIPGVAQRRKLPIIPGRETKPFYAARFAAAMEAGCDGVYLFNMEFKRLHDFMQMDVRDTDGIDKIYFATERGSGGYRGWHFLKDGRSFWNMAQIDPGEPASLKAGERRAFSMTIGDDFAKAAAKGLEPKIAMMVLTGLKDGSHISVTLNGETMRATTFKDGLFTFKPAPSQIRKGVNAFEIAADAATFLNDFAVSISYAKATGR